MATTYEPIATTTLGSTSNTITFSSISSAYTDLRLVFNLKSTSAGTVIATITVNGSGTGYSTTHLYGDGTSVISGRQTSYSNWGATGPSLAASATGLLTLDIFSYTGSTYKTALMTRSYDNNGSGSSFTSVQLWQNTAAISSITLSEGLANGFAAGTIATLYGIKAA